MIDIRVPGKMTEEYIAMMKIDPQQAENTYNEARAAVVELNADPNRWSKVALMNWLDLNPDSDWIPGCENEATG